MLDLGRYSAKNIQVARVYPSLVDRILEIVALLLILFTWGSAIWIYFILHNKSGSSSVFATAGGATAVALILGISAYIPIRMIKFPFRITEHNAQAQLFLARRLVRVLNVVTLLIFITIVFTQHEQACGIPTGMAHICTGIATILLILMMIIYYIFAYRYR